jgi:hypothetical protein
VYREGGGGGGGVAGHPGRSGLSGLVPTQVVTEVSPPLVTTVSPMWHDRPEQEFERVVFCCWIRWFAVQVPLVSQFATATSLCKVGFVAHWLEN